MAIERGRWESSESCSKACSSKNDERKRKGGGGFSTVAGSQQENVGATSAVAGVGEGFNNKRSCMKVNTGLDKGVQFSSSCGRDWVTMGHKAQWVTVFLPSKHHFLLLPFCQY